MKPKNKDISLGSRVIYVNKLREAGYEEALKGISLNKNSDITKMHSVAEKLSNLDRGHNKFQRFINVWLEIIAPRYWWQQFSTYKVGCESNSESTMHTILKTELTGENFSDDIPEETIARLNGLIKAGEFDQLKAELPESFLQKRIVVCNYATLRNILLQRSTHKLAAWHIFCRYIISSLDHVELLGMKSCSRCSRILSLNNFRNETQGFLGKGSRCHDCSSEKRTEYLRTFRGMICGMYDGMVSSSKNRNHAAPSFTAEELYLFSKESKEATDLYIEWVESGFLHELKPSWDRIDESVGYTFDNIVIVTWYENWCKSCKKRYIRGEKININTQEVTTYDSIADMWRNNISGDYSAFLEKLHKKPVTLDGYIYKIITTDTESVLKEDE